MGKCSTLLARAYNDLGYKESPPNSNRTKYGKFMDLQGQPWCMSAVQYWATLSAVRLPLRTGSCTALMEAAIKKGMWHTSNFRVGDIPIFQWKNGNRHTGIIVGVHSTYVDTIEGNTSVGNDTNGGSVMLRKRNKNLILGVVRPEYDEEDDFMSYKDFEGYMNRYRQQLRDNDQSKYAKEACDWAIKEGIVKGNKDSKGQPNYMWQDFMTREQFITMLYRYNQERK